MDWYKVIITRDEQDWHAKRDNVVQKFEELLTAHRAAPDSDCEAGLFGQRDGSKDVEVLYFSPGAVQIASSMMVQYGGNPCPEPDGDDLTLLAGDVAAPEPCEPAGAGI